MLSRTALRAAAQPLRLANKPLQCALHARHYASESSPKSSGGGGGPSTALLGVGGAAALAGAGYYFLSGQAGATATAPPPKPAFVGGEQGWVPLKVVEVEEVNHNTKKLRFALPEAGDVSGLHVASAILTKFKAPDAEKPTIRPYTPVSDEGDTGFLDLLVKKYPSGPMSSHIHGLAPGQTLDFKGPVPKYPWTANKHPHVALVAGGTGITPMYQLLRAIFNNPADTTRVTLVFGNIAEEDILLKAKLDELENTYPRRFRAFYLLDKPPKGWTGGTGYVTKELLKQVLPEPKEENIKVMVCGPPGLMEAVSGGKKSPKDQGELKGALKELGYTAEQVYKF